MIYLDYAATTPPHPEVIEAMLAVQKKLWANPSAAHSAGRAAKKIVDSCHDQIAAYCNVLPSEVLLTGTATEAINLALYSATQTITEQTGTTGTILISPLEHKAAQEYCTHLQTQGWNLQTIALTKEGLVDLAQLEVLCNTTPRALLCIQWVNSETGLMQPIEAIATLAKSFSIPYICDASQGIPHALPPKVLPDFMAFSPHKFYGPKGIGVLIAQKRHKIFPLVHGGGQEYGLRSGTENTAAMAGCQVALEVLATHLEFRTKHDTALQAMLHSHVEQHSYGTVTIKHHCIPSTTNILLHSTSAETALMKCDLQHICISTGSACSSGMQEQSKVLQALGLTAAETLRTIRISTGEATKQSDIATLCKVLEQL